MVQWNKSASTLPSVTCIAAADGDFTNGKLQKADGPNNWGWHSINKIQRLHKSHMFISTVHQQHANISAHRRPLQVLALVQQNSTESEPVVRTCFASDLWKTSASSDQSGPELFTSLFYLDSKPPPEITTRLKHFSTFLHANVHSSLCGF